MKLSKLFVIVFAVLVAAGTALITPALAQCGSGAVQDCSGGDGTPNGTDGPDGATGAPGLGDGENGGAGGLGGPGGNGPDGADGTAETEVISSPASLVNIDTSGGSGADAGVGGGGGNGGAGGLGTSSDGSVPGANGGAGGVGGAGGDGGNGGAGGDLSLTLAALISGDVILNARGGAGGWGGNAGDGGTGGAGGDRINAGVGGNGGNGGRGGVGGDGGNAGGGGDIALTVNARVSGTISVNAVGGEGGFGGAFGRGGVGGLAGTGRDGNGAPGLGGILGIFGFPGTAGGGGDITIDVNARVDGGINTTTSGSVNVNLNNGARVGGTINGDTGNQTTNATLAFSMTATQAESDALDALAAAGGSIVIGGQTYTWTNFDQIVNLLVINGVPNSPPRTADDGGSRTSAAPVCLLVDGAVNGIVRAAVPAGTVTDGSVFCRIINENGNFVQNPAELGTTALLNAGVLQAVDVFGLKREGVPAAAFNNAVEICLQGSGSLYYLDATQSPRVLQALNARQSGGFTCGAIPNAGTVVLTQSPDAPSAAVNSAESVSAEEALSGCRVTTRNMMNLRAAPSLDSNVLSKIPFDTTYDATARTAGWFRIVVGNDQGWVSADLVSTTGSCGG